MDKKMHQITERMKTAEKDVEKKKPAAAKKVLKKAQKANEKLVRIDKNVRDPKLERCDKAMKKDPRAFRKS